jgi:hypothetical protein
MQTPVSRVPTGGSRRPQEAARVKPKLLDQVRQGIHIRHYSTRTEKGYVDWIKRFILFHGKRHPLEMGEPEINRFLTGLAVGFILSMGRANNLRFDKRDRP